jgi:cysteine synthase
MHGATREKLIEKAAERCRRRNVVIPTLEQMKNPATIPAPIKARLGDVGLWDIDPANLFRISWKNEPTAVGGGFNEGNWIEFPAELTGVSARIIGLVGKHFPTGTHKVGAAFGCLVPRLVSGEFDATAEKTVWPSTGNFCRGGAFVSALLGCDAVAILPEGMSAERFEWLRSIGAEVIATPGSESNVREIYDKCWEIRRTRPDCVIFNQFEELGNAAWHYHVTGSAVQEIFLRTAGKGEELAAWVSATGSAGTIAAGDYLRTIHPGLRVAAVEALQCPTLLQCGFGEHRIEGIGDKHVPWIHNVRNTDMVVAVDDKQCIALMRLFAEPVGRQFLVDQGVSLPTVESLDLLGISSICNLIASIKVARYFDFGPGAVLFTPLTDSMELYQSRLDEQRQIDGPYTELQAARHFGRYLEGTPTDHMRELGYRDRKALHNLKYFTWVEQQGRSVEELDRLWEPGFWVEAFGQAAAWDAAIDDFNRRVGILP